MVGEGDAQEFTGPADVGDDFELVEDPGGEAVGADLVTSDVEGIVARNPGGDEGGCGIGDGLAETGGEHPGERAEDGTGLVEVAGMDPLLEADGATFLVGEEDGIVMGSGDQFPGGGALDEADLDLAPDAIRAELDFGEDTPSGIGCGAGEDEVEIEAITFDLSDHAFGTGAVVVVWGFEDGGDPAELSDVLALMGEAECGGIGGGEDALEDGVEG